MPLSRIIAATAVTILGVTGAASPAYADSGPWVSQHGDAGKATVSSDRKKIIVCDLDGRDELRFKAEYATDNPVDPTVYSVVAPQGGCEEGRTYISWIKVFKLCTGRVGMGGGFVWDDCQGSVWPRP